MESAVTPETGPKSTFAEQFSSKNKLEIPAGRANWIDIIPIVENPGSPPILVIPGWSITLATEKPFLEHLHNAGKRVIALEFNRFGGKAESKQNIAAEVVRQAEIIANLFKGIDAGKLDVAAQSMGVMALLAAARLDPGILEKIKKRCFYITCRFIRFR